MFSIPVIGIIKDDPEQGNRVEFHPGAEKVLGITPSEDVISLPGAPAQPLPDEEFAAFYKMFHTPPYDEQEALAAALALLPSNLQLDPYYVSLALIYANVPALKAAWDKHCFKSGRHPIDHEGLKKTFGLLSSGELFLAQLGLHLFNDYHKLPKDGLLGLRNLDSQRFELAMHAIRIFTRGI